MPVPALAWAALSSFAPGLFSGAFGRGDPVERRLRELRKLFDPSSINQAATTNFRTMLSSPAFAFAQNQAIQGGQAASGRISTALARSGLNNSGLGAAALGLGQSAASNNLGSLSANAWIEALRMAQENARSQANAIGGQPIGQNYGSSLFANGINSFLPFLFRYLQGQNTLSAAKPGDPRVDWHSQ